MKKTIALLLACVLMLACFAGCGSSSTASPATSAPGSADSAPTDSAAAPSDSTGGEKVLNVCLNADIQTMDVMQTTKDYMVPINIFDRLFDIEVLDDGSTKISNSLCESYEVSDDGLTYTFALRQGIVFSNGAELTAEDVLYSFSRLLSTDSVNADIPLEILGAEAYMEGAADTLEGFVVNDDYSFSITLASPNAGFIAELTSPAVCIVDKGTTETATNFGIEVNETIGTGPYKVTEWVTNNHITLEYNDKYWGEAPSVEKCIISIIPDASTQNLMYQNGELDIIDLDHLDSSIVTSTYETNYADRIVSRNRVALTYMALNANDTYLSDVNVRKAVQMAIDRQAIIDSVYNGLAVVQNGIIPQGVVGYNENAQQISYDPEGAKALLAEAGYAEGEIKMELSYDSSSNANTQMVYQIVQQYLQAIGIDAEIVSYDESSWLATRKAGDMCTFINTWTMDYNDPANIMYTFFGSTDKTTLRSINYADTAIMDRVAAASSIIDDAERYAEYQALEEKIVIEDAAWVPLYELTHLFAIGERVVAFVPHWAGYSDFFISDVVLA